jgi:hypothetical protein
MRAWAQKHPVHFESGSADVDENWKQRAGAVAAAACIAGTAGCSSTGQVLKTTQDVGRTTQTAKNMTRAGVNAELGQELRNFIRAQGGEPGSQNLSTLYQLQKRMTKMPDATNESASGYIPTKKQARDPRYSMALTVDIKPGQVGKEANKLGLKTNKQGQPQIARASGLFEKLALELTQFKQKGTLAKQAVAEGKIKLYTDPNYFGAEVDDYKASGPVVNIPANRLVGFEPDDKMDQPASKANVEKPVVHKMLGFGAQMINEFSGKS